VTETVGGVVSLDTVTLTVVDVAVFPAASRATAVSTCAPLAVVEVFQETEYGAVVSSAPSALPSSRNCTPATPTLSAAVAATVTVPFTVAPLAGAVIAKIGRASCRDSTDTLTAADALMLPAASRSRPVEACE